MGCYQPKKSDLDYMVVIEEAMTETEKREYMDTGNQEGSNKSAHNRFIIGS